MKALSFTLLLVVIVPLVVAAQEEEVDPLAEYSYLWEDTKKKKKKKKGKKEVATVVMAADTIPNPMDSTEQVSLVDSAQVSMVPDSLKQTAVLMPSDTIPEENALSLEEMAALEREQFVQDSIQQAERAEKREARLAKQEEKGPSNDFRAGLPMGNSGSRINGGLTFTTIDGKYYAGLVLAPELSFGKVGVGLDVPILYGLDDHSVRTEIFEDGVGPLRLIQYVRYGRQKTDPVYVKVGSLSNTMIGFGGLVNNYGNSISYEKRKIGIHYDINYKGHGGVEGLYSDFDPVSMNLLAVRPYVKPFKWTGIPIVHSIEFGAIFVKDKDQTALFADTLASTYKFTKEGISALGFDAGVTLLSVPFIQIDLFATYSKLNVGTTALRDSVSSAEAFGILDPSALGFKNGTGMSAGFNFRFNFVADIFSLDTRIERLSYTDYYLPQFFDSYYEINKDHKLFSLAYAGKMSGIYGSLTGNLLDKLKIGGSLMLPDDISETAPAVVTVNADIDRLANKISVHGRYFKGGLTDLSDAFELDERSLATLQLAYHLNSFIVTGLNYTWAFTNTDEGVKSTQYVSPFVGVSIQF